VRLLERLALHRPELRAWATYDWANSAFITVIVTAVWPIYFGTVSGLSKTDATETHAWITAAALTVSAILGPVLGALADRAPIKKKFLLAFVLLGSFATAGLALVAQGQWLFGGILFGLGNIGATSSFVFYDALLPFVAKDDELDRVSVAGYALGYVGGALLLLVLLLLIMNPEPVGLTTDSATRISFVVVALWWVIFTIPLLRRVPEPPISSRVRAEHKNVVLGAFADLRDTVTELRKYKQAFLFLIAFLIYNDGVGTIIRMATIFGTEKNLPMGVLIGAIVVVQIVGIPFTFLFGQLAGRIGSRASIYLGLIAYAGISVLGYFMTTKNEFIALAALVGVVQGGVQALSRSLFASMIPKRKSAEFFGLFAVFEKFAGIVGPFVFAVVIRLTGSSHTAILAIIAFFVCGALLLSRVDIRQGQEIANAENRQM
jgi:UMF1 family MFS transporter